MDLLWADRTFQTPLNNSTLLPLLLLSLARQKTTPHSAQWINSEYDYIIVGGGAAGSVVASRLSEVPCATVLLLEAGPEPPVLTEVPAFAKLFWRHPGIDWGFKTTPQKNVAFSHKSRQLDIYAGKVLGGTSSINGMVYVRGNRKNYDDWAAQGAKGWSYSDVFPYFLRLEDNRNFRFLANGYHARGGPITVENPRYVPEFQKIVYKAARQLGYPFLDSNADRQTGFYNFQLNVRDAQRCNTAKTYLVPADGRPNLHILLNAMVTKVIIENGQAKGVEFFHKNGMRVVKARKEVIVSAGAHNTPKLLMLSGIGPREELKKWDIFMNADLPVGKNLQDHGVSTIYFTVNSTFSTFEKLSDPSVIRQYIHSRAGPLSSTGIIANAFLNGLNVAPFVDFPNIKLHMYEERKLSEDSSFLRKEVYRSLFGRIGNDVALFSCGSAILQPKSRGYVTLMSLNPFDPPAINPNYLEDPRDLEVIVDGLKVCNKFLNSETFQKVGVKPLKSLPACDRLIQSEDEYFRCYARQIFLPQWHLVGTAKMGDPADRTTVVDTELRVKKIRSLRVVDASVMPIVISGNTHIPTVMVAEKASDMIKRTLFC